MSSATTTAAARPPSDRAVLGGLIAALALLALKCAWVCDDAYITFRVVENLWQGHGLRWNVAERVQAYTNPLWLALVAGARGFSGEVYFTSIALGLACTVLTALSLVTRAAVNGANAALALAVCIGSKAWVDFATSGLENPLLHLALLGAWIALAERRSSVELGLWCAAAALTRLDSLVLLAPALALHVARATPRRALLGLALGGAPLVAWELFSLVYYGALSPNTAIAKLNTGLGASELVPQGARYLLESLTRDPLTLCAILAAAALAALRRDGISRALAGGIALHLAYVVWVGGDFMSGRFLTAPLCCAAFLFARYGVGPAPRARVAALAALALSVATPLSPLRAPLDYSRGLAPDAHVSDSGIADERGYWYAAAGLFSPTRALDAPPYRHVSKGHGLAFRLRDEQAGPRVIEGIGYLGYWAGPGVHLIDPMGLSDAFLARLPIVVYGEVTPREKNAFRGRAWRVGHYYRDVPPAYLAWLAGEAAAFDDPQLAALHADVVAITRGELFDAERWSAIGRRLR